MNTPKIILPEQYGKVKSLPEDPPMSETYMFDSAGTQAFVQVYPIPLPYAMPFEEPEKVIAGIRSKLSEDQGIIQVENGGTKANCRYIWSIVKTLKKPSGIQYTLTMHIEREECVMHLQGYFDENGKTGLRDFVVFDRLSHKKAIRVTKKGIDGWMKDPYDPAYTRGVLMNLSEQQKYDELFPDHPLSVLRQLIRDIVEQN